MTAVELAILGGGVMGEVLSKGVTHASLFQPGEILVYDHNQAKLDKLHQETGVSVSRDIRAAAAARILLLAVKPDNVADVLRPISQFPEQQERLLISIVAGVPLAYLAQFFKPKTPMIRVMTNTPCVVQAGMSALSPNPCVTEDQLAITRRIFAAVGEVLTLPEKYLDAVTGLSGSGPAFFFIIIDAMIEGGVLQGLPRAVARQLVLQTMYGSALLIRETEQHPGLLRDMVTSPGGTTIAGIQVMEEYKMRAAMLKTIETATRRSQELGHQKQPKAQRESKA